MSRTISLSAEILKGRKVYKLAATGVLENVHQLWRQLEPLD